MKRFFGFYLFVFLCLTEMFSLSAQSPVFSFENTSENHVGNIKQTLKLKGLKKGYAEIYNESADLSFSDKQRLYSQYKDDPLGPFLLNGLVGFGVGSFLQKDYLSGGLCLTADLTSVGLLLTGLAFWYKELLGIASKPQPHAGDLFGIVFSGAAGLPFWIAGGIISMVSRLYGFIAPLIYSASYNKRLEGALRVNENRLSIAPLVLPDTSCGFALRLEL